MEIVLDTYGLSLSVRNGCFQIVSGDKKRMVHPSRISGILVTMPCRLSSPAIVLAALNGIAITICSRTGKPEARLWSPDFPNTPAIRHNQYRFSKSPCRMEWAKKIIAVKMEGQLHNLRFIAGRKPGLEAEVADAEAAIMKKVAALQLLTNTLPDDLLKKIRYLEASTAMLYWPLLGKKLPEPFGFTERVKKDPKDPFNMSINYLYGMLKNKVETGILGMGLDPSVGCIHREGYSLPPLVFDLMEPFRPVMDRLLVELILSGKLKNIVETKDDGSCRLNSTGRKCLIACFNEKIGKVLIFRKARTTLGNHILLEIKSFADEIKKI